MFCKKCGNEISETTRFCGKCGAAVRSDSVSDETRQAVLSGNDAENALGSDGNVALMLMGCAVIYILQLIFWFVKSLTASASAFGMKHSESVSLSALMSEADAGFVTAVMIIFCVICAVITAMPLFTGKTCKRRRMIFPIITSVLNMIMLLGLLLIANEDMPSYASVSLTFGGVLFLLCTVSSIVLSVFIAVKTKKYGAQKVVVIYK